MPTALLYRDVVSCDHSHTVGRRDLFEIAEILGVNRQRANRIILDHRDFPDSMVREGRSRFWDRREVVAWATVWRREKPWR